LGGGVWSIQLIPQPLLNLNFEFYRKIEHFWNGSLEEEEEESVPSLHLSEAENLRKIFTIFSIYREIETIAL
jgi:hypothetical protein